MASNDTSAIHAGRPAVTGGVFTAPLGTTLPDDASTALEADFVGLGYVGEDGLSETNSRDSEQIREWGGKVVKVLQTDTENTYQLTLLQSGSPDVLKEVYGEDNVSVVGSKTTITNDFSELPHKVWVFDMAEGNSRRRIAIPDGQITEVGDITYARGEAVAFEVTVTAFPDASGVTHVKFEETTVSGS